MIKETVNESRFTDVLMFDEYAGWTYGAIKALYDYYEQLSEDIGEDIELDPVAIRCEWTEYDSAWDAMEEYQPDDMPTIEEASEQLAREWLEERTTVLDVKNVDHDNGGYITSVLVMQF
jgi:hypothetical protein